MFYCLIPVDVIERSYNRDSQIDRVDTDCTDCSQTAYMGVLLSLQYNASIFALMKIKMGYIAR